MIVVPLDGLLSNVHPRLLNVHFNSITRIEDNTFLNQNKVEILRLTGNSVTAITSNTFAGLKQIKSLHSSNIGYIKKLVAYSFRDLPEISLIDLELCGIVTIETHAFYNLTGTLTLNLRSNSIVEIQSKAFSGLTGVEKIDLEYNKLKTIRADTFIDMPNLGLVILKENDILEIEENAFGDLPELLFLSLVSNNLICSCKIRPFYLWLKRSATVVDGAICADKNGQRIKTLSNVEECTETTTVFDTTAATTNEVSTMIETTVLQVSSITTANAGLQDQQDVNTKLSSQMNETTNQNERTVTLTSTKSDKSTLQTTYSTSEETSEDKPDTNTPFLQVTLLGIIACILAAIALIIIVIYISYRERCKDHKPIYESTTIENAGEVMHYDVLELPDVSTIE
ncbi:SLIT1 [Mytilus edulis]|uniref:SLIT1 n=1 Tax=Mytilus edulis TaxID=6550 RepID=A0A8S3TC48_MYTED|nr:SLIT1 [Mytilus edulis]